MDDAELAARSIQGFAAMLALLEDGRGTGYPWIDATVGDSDAHTVWLSEGTVVPSGRVEDPSIAMPVLGLELGNAALDGGEQEDEAPPLDVVGAINDRAYEQGDVLGPLFAGLSDAPGLATHGIRIDGEWACVLVTLRVGDDVAIHYVATDSRFRRRGLASRLIRGVLAEVRDAGAVSATLQASPDGLSVYERLGFRRVGLLRAFQRGN